VQAGSNGNRAKAMTKCVQLTHLISHLQLERVEPHRLGVIFPIPLTPETSAHDQLWSVEILAMGSDDSPNNVFNFFGCSTQQSAAGNNI
jgi:hypothetical protein